MQFEKTRVVTPLCWLALIVSSGFAYGEKPKVEMRDAATHDSLVRVLQSAQLVDPMVDVKPSEVAEDPSKNVQVDLLDRADIVSFNGLTTLVPKRAILVIPEPMKLRIGTHKPGHKFVDWPEFLQANRGWINTMEVTRAQAQGAQPLPVDTTERISRGGSVIVATYQGSPISIAPMKETESQTPTEE